MLRTSTMTTSIARAAILISCGLALTPAALAHGTAGKRFFPATMAIEDPLPADELGFTYSKLNGEDETEHEIEGEFSKRLTNKLSISIGREWMREEHGARVHEGWGNVE